METTAINEVNVHPENFELILQDHKLNYRIRGNYLLVGNEPSIEDRIIYISVIQSQIYLFIETIIPFISDNKLSFQIVKNLNIAKWILDGVLGYRDIGKLLTVYISKNADYGTIISELINLTSAFNGPVIPDAVYLGGTCYTQPTFTIHPASTNNNSNARMIFQGKYAVLSTLKEDSKGNVYKGIYFNRFLIPAFCIIKQGRQFMISDQAGRDMKDRIQWQKKVQDDLAGIIHIPKVIDHFEEDGDCYLVMELVKGKTLERRINEIYNGKVWTELSEKERISLLDLMLEILGMVERIHQNSYVHRDLTHVNFLVKRKKCYLIDWELAYNVNLIYPLPAFKLGTEGFMSPEQKSGESPTVKEDIFGLGALMMALFTNMPPVKFQSGNIAQLKRILYFFTNKRNIGKVVGKCLHKDPAKRPGLDYLKRFISGLSAEPMQYNRFWCEPKEPNGQKLASFLRTAFDGLTIPELTGNNGLFTAKGAFDLRTGQRNSSTLASGLNAPMTAIQYLLFHARSVQFFPSTTAFFTDYIESRKHLILNMPLTESPGLFYGSAGRALMIHYLSLNNLMFFTGYRKLIDDCFLKNAKRFGLAEGIAGQVLVALLICKTSQSCFLVEKLQGLVSMLLAAQLADGSWPGNGETKMSAGLDYGIAGIILVLVKYDRLYPAQKNKTAIVNALKWLSKHGIYNNPLSFRKVRSEKQDSSLISGSAGVALSYLYGYEHLQKAEYLRKAEKILYCYPEYSISFNYSLATGIAGLGLVYLKAARLTGHSVWNARSMKIYQVLRNTYQAIHERKRTWIVGGQKEFDASLLTGTTGILFFILKVYDNPIKPA